MNLLLLEKLAVDVLTSTWVTASKTKFKNTFLR
jgi:hypothetical protein